MITVLSTETNTKENERKIRVSDNVAVRQYVGTPVYSIGENRENSYRTRDHMGYTEQTHNKTDLFVFLHRLS